jgi:Tfp pilus assembly protein PilF
MKPIILILLTGLIVSGCGLRSETAQAPTQQQKSQSVSSTQAGMPSDQQPLVRLAIDLLQKGEIPAGVKALDEAIKNNPRDIEAYTLLGQTYMHVNQLDLAVEIFEAALNVDPENGEIYYMLAVTNGLRGQRDLAIVSAEKSLRIFEKQRDEEKFKRALVLLHGLSQE